MKKAITLLLVILIVLSFLPASFGQGKCLTPEGFLKTLEDFEKVDVEKEDLAFVADKINNEFMPQIEELHELNLIDDVNREEILGRATISFVTISWNSGLDVAEINTLLRERGEDSILEQLRILTGEARMPEKAAALPELALEEENTKIILLLVTSFISRIFFLLSRVPLVFINDHNPD